MNSQKTTQQASGGIPADETPEIQPQPRFQTDTVSQPDGSSPPEQAPNPFDPQSLILPQSYLQDASARAMLVSLALRRPKPDEYFRVHPAKEYRMGPVAVIKSPLERDFGVYAIAVHLAEQAKTKHQTCTLRICININGALFVWPLPIPGAGGETPLAWHQSAVTVANRAEFAWLKLVSDTAAGNYMAFEAGGDIPQPVWPPTPPLEIFRLALKDRHIASAEHPIYRRLLGFL